MFALVDCNNFYASCERLFRPDLQNKPIVVLSNNDGCVIARSNEAKDLGIAMGEPFFKIKDLVRQKKVQVFSSNFALYGDLSQRVMSVIESHWPIVEIYSVDEAFLDLRSLSEKRIEPFCNELQKTILQWTGIPTSIGIGPTKTLAKAANFVCKKKLKIPVFDISKQRRWLSQLDVGDVWGIGWRWQKQLHAQGIRTAQDLANANPFVIRKQFNVIMERTALELQGIICNELSVEEPKKSILSSKSFGNMQTDLASIEQALSSHCARASANAREQGSLANRITVFLRSNKHRQDLKQYMNSISCKLIRPSSDVRVITEIAKLGLAEIFREGIFYKKVGVILEDLISEEVCQFDLFAHQDETQLQRDKQLMNVFDQINSRYGKRTIKLAAEGYSNTWKMRRELCSPCYTTRWHELLAV